MCRFRRPAHLKYPVHFIEGSLAKKYTSSLITVQTKHILAGIRRDFYSFLSSTYIHIPEKKILEFAWGPAVELIEFPQDGSEDSIQHIDKGLKLITSYGSKNGLLDEKVLTDLSRDWTRLFRGVEKEGILPPYESLYRTGKLQEKPSREIHRLFSEMGIRIPDEWHQPPDYVGVELDFMRLLCSRELEAYEKQDAKALSETLHQEQAFVENHLGAWVPQFCEKMFSEAREDYFRGLARLTAGLIAYDRIHTKNRISGVA